MTSHSSEFSMHRPEDFRKFLAEMGPDMLHQMFRQPVLMLWMALPPSKRNIAILKDSVRQQYERVLNAFETDVEVLALGNLHADADDPQPEQGADGKTPEGPQSPH